MKTALIVVDMLNSYEHDDADRLTESVERIVGPLAGLIERASAGPPRTAPPPPLVDPAPPPEGADFVIKARHTVFYMTPLEYLLSQREIGHVVLAGQVTEQCILYSALDAYVRHLDVTIPTDGVAHIHEDLAQAALKMMERNMQAQLVSAADCRLEA